MLTTTIISNPKPTTQLLLTCQILQVLSATLSSERMADGLALVFKLGDGRTLGWVCWSGFFLTVLARQNLLRQGGNIIVRHFIVLRFHTGVARVQYIRIITSGFQRLPTL
jgi:hypothetical protein